MNKRYVRGNQYRRNALTAALALSLGLTGVAYGQATTGSVFGTAPVAAGETVRVVSNQTGLTREVSVGSDGHYSASQLPVGEYTVSLMQNGNVVSTHNHVLVSVAGGAPVVFAAAAGGKNVENLGAVTVTANALPAIDVSSTRQTSVITAQQLKQLPLARNAESIALLAPGTSGGNASLGTGPAGTPLISFGGDSTVENAYYINGFNTTDPVGNAGGIALPYFAIAEQQTITSGYGAEYGRSTGGVISQIGHRGGNEFHAGAYVTWRPTWAQGTYDNIHYANPESTNPGQRVGDMFVNRQKNEDWSQIYDAYISGPLIKDKLFFYLTAEAQHDSRKTTGSVNSPYYNSHSTSSPKFYGKLDWNINDNNILEGTYASSKLEDLSNNAYNYDYSTHAVGSFNNINNPLYSSKFNVGILKYTSYITDNLTLSVLAGKMKSTYASQTLPYAGFDPTLAGLAGISKQNPAVPGYGNQNNNSRTGPSPGHKSSENNFRMDLDWKLGNHDVKFGIDNMRSTDISDGSVSYGPGYYWVYERQGAGNTAPNLTCNTAGQCVANPALYPNGKSGYFVEKRQYGAVSSFTVEQKAQYIEDNWQITPNLLLNLGLRNDQFTNYNAGGHAYIRETKPQWQPRLGFSWDIFGDSSAKLYGNVGRYYLALPTGLGVRMAGANRYINEYYTYSSIDANGIPQGLTRVPTTSVPYSPDGEYGTPKDAHTIAATDLKAMYQDEYVLGFQKAFHAFGQSLVWTSQATYSKMNNVIDDVGTVPAPPADANLSAFQYDILVNPGRSNTMRYLTNAGTYSTYTWNPHTASAAGYVVGYPKAFRKYYSLEESLEHPWDGKWMGKIDYVFAKSFGTTEGPTYSPLGQTSNASAAAGGGQSGSISEAWDFPEIMQYSNGELPNSHRHTLKAYGTYAITPEWLVSGLYIIQSGAPITCLGSWGTSAQQAAGMGDPGNGYGEAYHWCGGMPSPPGKAGHTPWTHQLDLSVSYIPEWAGKHLTLQVQVHNVFNEQKDTAYVVTHDYLGAPDASYKLPYGGVAGYAVEPPRYAEFSVKYDW
ncbi:TonB-dependent receptor [Rhodanobacter sp. 115]|uniref:TonB-dependent receptor n=1 Tax=Rhodanobacter sp. FW021-MT20 TaxID=1162282 RepID=UPI0034E527BB